MLKADVSNFTGNDPEYVDRFFVPVFRPPADCAWRAS
jgi:hypothetical protein